MKTPPLPPLPMPSPMPESERSESVCPSCGSDDPSYLWYGKGNRPDDKPCDNPFHTPTDKGAEERCSECGCELDPAFAWCLGCSTTLNQRVEEQRQSLESAAFALQRIEERLHPGKTGNPKGQWDTCLRIAQEELEELRSALSQQDSKP